MDKDTTGTPDSHEPTVKGLFVRSHIENLRKAKGAEGVKELERRFGKSVNYDSLEEVPVSDEIRILEIALDILSDGTIPEDKRSFEAGRLHFTGFSTTPWAKMVFSIFSGNLKYQVMHVGLIVEKIFKGIKMHSEETGPHSVAIYIDNAQYYNPEHFRGLLQEWVEHMGYAGTITASTTESGESRFEISWTKEPKQP
jgi:uncharacterized protein (TIGR02265 family)